MSHLIEKHQLNNKGRGVIRRKSLLSPEQEAAAQNYVNQQLQGRSDAIAENTRTTRDNANNQRRTLATKQAIREDLKKNPIPSLLTRRVTIASTTNPDDVRTERVVQTSRGKNPQFEERKENPNRRVSDELLQQYYNNQELEKRFNEEVLPATGEFLSTVIPSSKHLGYLYGKLDGSDSRSFAEQMLGTNERLRNPVLNIIGDFLTPAGVIKGLLLGSKALGYIPKFMRFYNSPLTHKWTLFGNKMYRMNPRANSGFPEFESKGVDRSFIDLFESDPYPDTPQVLLLIDNLGLRLENLTPYLEYLRYLRDKYGMAEFNSDLASLGARHVATQGRYTKADIERKLASGSYFPMVQTGGHGSFIDETTPPAGVFSRLTSLRFNPYIGRNELSSIRADNPRGYSGILLGTHTGDTSVDSSELAYAMARQLGEDYYPLVPAGDHFMPAYVDATNPWNGKIIYNNLGYKNLFVPQPLWDIDDKVINLLNTRLRKPQVYWSVKPNSSGKLTSYFDIAPEHVSTEKLFTDYGFRASRESDGSLILSDSHGHNVGRIEALDPDYIVETHFNEPILKFNKKFGTKYPNAEIVSERTLPYELTFPQWTFRKSISGPDMAGILYNKGGKLLTNKK